MNARRRELEANRRSRSARTDATAVSRTRVHFPYPAATAAPGLGPKGMSRPL